MSVRLRRRFGTCVNPSRSKSSSMTIVSRSGLGLSRSMKSSVVCIENPLRPCQLPEGLLRSLLSGMRALVQFPSGGRQAPLLCLPQHRGQGSVVNPVVQDKRIDSSPSLYSPSPLVKHLGTAVSGPPDVWMSHLPVLPPQSLDEITFATGLIKLLKHPVHSRTDDVVLVHSKSSRLSPAPSRA